MLNECKYADLLDDDVFKLVFGRESTKDVMIEFLNQVIQDRNIVDLEFLDKEMHPVERDQKGSVYDMFCKTQGIGDSNRCDISSYGPFKRNN